MTIRVFTGISVCLALFLSPLLGCAKEPTSCADGYQREVKERIVKPAIFTDVFSDRIVVYESTELVTLPAEWEWVDKPKDYIRPKFLEVEQIHVGSFGWTVAEVEIIFQPESSDVVKKLDGTIQGRTVAAIKKKSRRRFQSHPVTYYSRTTKIPFNKDEMERATQIRVLKKPSLLIQRDVEFLPNYVTERFDVEFKPIPNVTKTKSPNVVGRIREPAEIEEYLGPCEKAAP